MKSVISLSIFHCLLLLTFFRTNHGLSDTGIVNVAINKTATSSTTYGGKPYYAANKAADGFLKGQNYFRSRDLDNQWWRVDLAEKFFVVDVKVYKRLTTISDDSSDPTLRDVYLLLRNDTADLNSTRQNWNVVGNQKNEIAAPYPNNYFGYNSTLATTQLPIARFVAVYSEHDKGLGIDEVVVSGLARDNLRPSQLKAGKGDTSDCVEISWEAALEGAVVYYEVRYDNGSWIPVGNSLSVQKCSVSPYQLLKIDVRVYGATVSESTDVQLQACTGPSEPQSVLEEGPVLSDLAGYKWMYTISWKSPAEINCESISYYEVRHPDLTSDPSPIWLAANHLRTVLHTDSNVQIHFSVRAVNNAGLLSEYATLTFTAPILAPVWGSARVDVEADSSSCVTFSWATPEYPYGDIISYEYICSTPEVIRSTIEWNKVEGVKLNKELQICKLAPYQPVQCNVTARNNDGVSEVASSNVTLTHCSAPVWGSARIYLEADNSSCVTLSWATPEYPYGDIISYEYICSTTEVLRSTIGWNKLEVELNEELQICKLAPYQPVQCNVTARNNDGVSEVASSNVTLTHCSEPQLPQNLVQYITEEVYSISEGVEGDRMKIQLAIPKEAIIINCEKLVSVRYKLANDTTYTQNGSYIKDLDVLTAYTVEVRVINNEMLETVQIFTVTTESKSGYNGCDPPPDVENGRYISAEAYATVIYSCKDGFTTHGDSILQCRYKDGLPEWMGDPPKCVSTKSVPTGWIVSAAVAGVIIICLIIALIVVILKRRKPSGGNHGGGPTVHQSKPTNSTEYSEIGLDRLPAELNLNRDIYGDIDNVTEPPITTDPYEVLDVQQREPAALYEVLSTAAANEESDGIRKPAEETYQNI